MSNPLLATVLATLLASSAWGLGTDRTPPKLISTKLDTLYIPHGFDDNDNVQIVVEGAFPNTCYRPSEMQISLDRQAKVITLGARAWEYATICLQVVIPYNRPITLGLMEAGQWKVMQEGEQEPMGILDISVAQNDGPDDYLYAPISQAYVEASNISNKKRIKISGQFTNSCMKISDVKVQVQPKVISVQPISEMEKRDDCVAGNFPFEKSILIDSPKPGNYLLHVRSLNGNAVNNIVSIN